MSDRDLLALMPLLVLAAAAVVVMLAIAWRRHHGLVATLAALGLAGSLASLPFAERAAPRSVTPLLVVDGPTLYYWGLLLSGSLVVTALVYLYPLRGGERWEELYLLLLLATLGAAVLAASVHFASLFLGLELLSVSLYAMIAYPRQTGVAIEAGVKYLILAAASSAFLLFGLALSYAVTGELTLTAVAIALEAETPSLVALAAVGLLLAAVGFKLALVPFHLWTPDVYAGAPAPVTAFVATVSKGAMFAVVLRLFHDLDGANDRVVLVLTLLAVLSMLFGNLLALLQDNLKRLLAYSSIAHLGYLLVTLLAAGELAQQAAAYYLTAYFVATLGAFAVVTCASDTEREADRLEDYRGLFWRRPAVAAFLTASLLSLAGIPLTAGFVGKFLVLTAGVDSGVWIPVFALLLGSAIGLYYYLRVIVVMWSDGPAPAHPRLQPLGALTLVSLAVPLLLLGVYPQPLMELIRAFQP